MGISTATDSFSLKRFKLHRFRKGFVEIVRSFETVDQLTPFYEHFFLSNLLLLSFGMAPAFRSQQLFLISGADGYNGCGGTILGYLPVLS